MSEAPMAADERAMPKIVKKIAVAEQRGKMRNESGMIIFLGFAPAAGRLSPVAKRLFWIP